MKHENQMRFKISRTVADDPAQNIEKICTVEEARKLAPPFIVMLAISSVSETQTEMFSISHSIGLEEWKATNIL